MARDSTADIKDRVDRLELEACRILLGLDEGGSVVDGVNRLIAENDRLREDVKAAEEEADRMRALVMGEFVKILVDATGKLINECRGFLALAKEHEPETRTFGVTNLRCFEARIEAASQALGDYRDREEAESRPDGETS